MAMTNEEFAEKVNGLEEFAAREPSKYAARVGLLAALGYAYIFLVLAVIIGAVVLILVLTFAGGRFNFWVLKFGWILLMLAAVVARALWVRIPPPEGVEITRAQAPRLFELVDELTRALDSPRVHKVLVSGDYNASLSQIPALGLFGWPRNYLTLGLPLMQALTAEQFRAVLAHELGHLSGNHGRFSSWVYRVRRTWGQLLERLEREDRWGSFVFTKFINWYAPYLNAYSFVLARRHEYDADAAAAQVAGARNAAEALAVVELKGAYLSERYWPEIFKRADEQAEPARGAYARMGSVLREPVPAGDAQLFLRRSLARETGYDDTHPSLAARLGALGLEDAGRDELVESVAASAGPRAGESSADYFLGGLQEELAGKLDLEWFESVTPFWQELHRYRSETRKKLAALEEKAAAGELSIEEAWERAGLTLEFKGEDEALPLLREVVGRKPEHAGANFTLGRILVSRGDAEGIAHVERAMAAEPDAVAEGLQLLYAFFRERGQEEEAEEYRRRLMRHFDAADLAARERASFTDGEPILPHTLTAEELEGLRGQLRRFDEVEAAYLARKLVMHFPEKPVHVLGVVVNAPWYKFRSTEADVNLIRTLVSTLQFPGETFVLILNRNKKTAKDMKAMDGALIYPAA